MAAGSITVICALIFRVWRSKVAFMNWQEGQRVECTGLNWGICYVTMTNLNMVVVYCPQHDIVVTGSPEQLEQAGWQTIDSPKVIYIAEWIQNHHPQPHPVPTQ